MSIVFALGYMGIVFEEFLAFNKSGVALLMAVTLWTIRSIGVCMHACICIAIIIVRLTKHLCFMILVIIN